MSLLELLYSNILKPGGLLILNQKYMPDKRSIFIGTSVHRWNDNRIFHKEAVSLAYHFSVQLHAPADFDYKTKQKVKVFGLPLWSKESDRKYIRRELWSRLKKSDSEIFYFHDPELIWIGIKARIFLGKKIVYDVHENTVESIKGKKWLNTLTKGLAIIGYKLFEWIGKQLFNHFILAEDSYKILIPHNSTIVLNYPIVEESNGNSEQKLYDLVYLGDVREDRGALIILELINQLKKKREEIKIALLGKIVNKEKFDIIIEKYCLEQNIKFFGYVDYQEAINIVKKSKVGLCLLKPTQNFIHSYPTKLFDYMNAGIPFVSSNFQLYDELIQKSNAGISVDPLNITEVINAVSKLLGDADYRDQLGQNGRSSLQTMFNWNTQSNILIDVMNSL